MPSPRASDRLSQTNRNIIRRLTLSGVYCCGTAPSTLRLYPAKRRSLLHPGLQPPVRHSALGKLAEQDLPAPPPPIQRIDKASVWFYIELYERVPRLRTFYQASFPQMSTPPTTRFFRLILRSGLWAALLVSALLCALSTGCVGKKPLALYLNVEPSPEGYWVHALFQNVGKPDLTIWESGFWPNTRIVFRDVEGNVPPLTARGKQQAGAFSPGGTRDKNYPVTLKRYEVHRGDPVLLDAVFVLDRSKSYFVQIVYEEAQDNGWKGLVMSNVVRISPPNS